VKHRTKAILLEDWRLSTPTWASFKVRLPRIIVIDRNDMNAVVNIVLDIRGWHSNLCN